MIISKEERNGFEYRKGIIMNFRLTVLFAIVVNVSLLSPINADTGSCNACTSLWRNAAEMSCGNSVLDGRGASGACIGAHLNVLSQCYDICGGLTYNEQPYAEKDVESLKKAASDFLNEISSSIPDSAETPGSADGVTVNGPTGGSGVNGSSGVTATPGGLPSLGTGRVDDSGSQGSPDTGGGSVGIVGGPRQGIEGTEIPGGSGGGCQESKKTGVKDDCKNTTSHIQ